MRMLYGLCNNNIDRVSGIINQYRKRKGKDLKVQVVGFEEQAPKLKADVILVPTSFLFQRSLKALNKSKAVVFVFDSPMQCHQLKPIELLDVSEIRDGFRFEYKPLTDKAVVAALEKGLANKKKVKVTKATIDVIPTLLAQGQSSVTGPIMTFVYKAPNSDDRDRMLGMIFTWMIGTDDISVLVKALSTRFRFKKTPKSLLTMVEFFESKAGKNARAAIQEITKLKLANKQINYKKISDRYHIGKSDLKYVLQLFRRNKTFREMNVTLKQLFLDRKAGKLKEKANAEDGDGDGDDA